MGRPRREPPDRIQAGIRFRREIHERLVEEADARDLSVNWMVNRAVERFLDDLIPVDEWKLTRDE